MITIVRISYRNYTFYRSCLPIYGIAIVRSLSFLFLDDFKGNANISIAIKSCSTVLQTQKLQFQRFAQISSVLFYYY